MKGLNKDTTPISKRIDNAESWVIKDMQPNRWYDIKPDQVEIFKLLISDRYGWPDFALSLNNEYNKVKKIMI